MMEMLADTYKNSPVGPRLEKTMLVSPNSEPIRVPDAKITAIVQTYQAAEGLKQTLESLQGRVDRILVLDGYFSMRGTPHPHPLKTGNGASTDNSEQITKNLGGEWIPADREYRGQIDKLNRIPELVINGEWIFLIDTDEILVSYVKDGLRTMAGWFGQYCDMIPVRIDEPYYQHPFTGQYGRNRLYARLMRVLKGMQWTNEGTVKYPEGRVTLYMGTMASTCYIQHLRKGY